MFNNKERDKMKTFTIVGRVFSRTHGYLATRESRDIEAKNKTAAIKLARPLMSGCNRFEVAETEEYNPAIAQENRDYWAQEDRISDDPEIS